MSQQARSDNLNLSKPNINRQNHFNAKPQDTFCVPVDNSRNPFVPRIKSKPNALVPLDVSPAFSKRGRILKNGSHPYEYEINSLTFPEDQIKKCEPINWLPMEQTPLRFVDTVEQLITVVEQLKMCTEIAVDLEGHTRRSFLVKIKLI